MLKTYAGSCHCGKVRFEADIDLSRGTVKCNCSTCTKTRSWVGFVGPQHYRLMSGAEAQTEYQWIPPGREAPSIQYHFCATCGCVAFWRAAQTDAAGRKRIAVNLRLAEPEVVAAIPIDRFDGLGAFADLPRDGRSVRDVWC